MVGVKKHKHLEREKLYLFFKSQTSQSLTLNSKAVLDLLLAKELDKEFGSLESI